VRLRRAEAATGPAGWAAGWLARAGGRRWVGLQRGVAGLGRLGWAGRGKGVKEERERV
jgi:hypothetical protein